MGMMNITLDINGRVIRKIKVWNCHPHPTSGEDQCPYQVTDDLTGYSFFITHKRSEGAAVLANTVLSKLTDYFFLKALEDEQNEKEKKKEEKDKSDETPGQIMEYPGQRKGGL
jgi:hypothetical protein